MKQFLLAGLVTCLMVATGRADPITVFVDPGTQTVAPGDLFTVDLLATLDAGDTLFGWGMDVRLDVPLITQQGTPLIGPDWISGAPCIDGDGLCGTAASLLYPPSGPITVLLASLEFEALSPGLVTLLLSSGPEADEGFAPLGPPGARFDVNYHSGTVTVTPEPGTIVLLSTFLGVAAFFAWRRKQPVA